MAGAQVFSVMDLKLLFSVTFFRLSRIARFKNGIYGKGFIVRIVWLENLAGSHHSGLAIPPKPQV